MTDDSILQRIREVARIHIGWQGSLEPQMRLVEGLGLDSIKMMTLALEIENDFRICLDPTHDDQLETIADLVKAIKSQLNKMS
jgi:acyl carrier protein